MENLDETQEQKKYRHPSEDKPWLFKPGQSGNPGGRPKGSVSLKGWVERMLREMSPEEKKEFVRGMSKEVIWKMGEGNPRQDTNVTGELTISKVLDDIEDNGQEIDGQGVENQQSVSDTEQETKVD